MQDCKTELLSFPFIPLEQKGLVISFRDHKDRKRYELAEQGEQLGQTLDTAKRHSDGSPVVQIKWYSRILEVLKGEGGEWGSSGVKLGTS